MEYLNYRFEDNEKFINTFDEAPLWSAAFGLMLFKHLEFKPGMTVIDIGSGAGFPLLELAGRMGSTSKIYGIDPWKTANARARQKIENYGYKNVELIEASAENIPLEANSIDLVVSNLGINNFQNPEVVFIECFRVLKPGGKLVLTTNCNGHWKLFYDIFESTLKRISKTEYIPKLTAQQEHRGNIQSISAYFSESGFKVERIFEDHLPMNFANGTAFLNHHFVKLGWMASWLEIFPQKEHREIFSELEKDLNSHSEKYNGLKLNVPMIFMEGGKE